MSATRDARTAKRKLAELGITSATVLTGSTTITIDLAAFDELVRWHHRYVQAGVSARRGHDYACSCARCCALP